LTAARTKARQRVEAYGLDAAAIANATFEAQRAADVQGREGELARIHSYLSSDSLSSESAGVDGSPLLVTGAAGTGKSTLLAEATKRIKISFPGAVSITRYVGVTPGTSTLVNLLSDLRQRIVTAYNMEELETSVDLPQLVDSVSAILADSDIPA